MEEKHSPEKMRSFIRNGKKMYETEATSKYQKDEIKCIEKCFLYY